MTPLAVLLALAGACCYASAAWLQQGAVHTAAGDGGLRRTAWLRLLHAPRWLTGFGLTALGATLHVAALSMAPLVVVQPLGVSAIAVTAVLANRSAGTRLTGATKRAVLASTLGVALFVIVAAGSSSAGVVSAGVELRACLLTALLMAGAAALGLVANTRLRCGAFATATGLAYGLVSVLVHITALRVQAGGLGAIQPVAVLAVVLALVVGGWLVQHAYACGPPQVTVAFLTVVDPMLGVGVGIWLLGEGTGLVGGTVVLLAVGAASAVAGVVVLARHRPADASVVGPSTVEKTMVPTPPADASSTGLAPLRILIGADTFPPDINGASHFTLGLARGLAGRGHEVHVICPAAQVPVDDQIIDNLTVHRVASWRTPFHPTFRFSPPWRAFRAVEALVEALDPDVVHVQAHFLIGRAAVRTAARRGIALIATNHFMPENLLSHAPVPNRLRAAAARLGWWDLRRVFCDADAVTAPTQRAVELLAEQRVPGAEAVSCGIDLDHFHTTQPIEPTTERAGSTRRILFVGRLDEEKRVDDLLRALALLAEHDVRLDIVGDGSRRAGWQQLVDRLGIAARVRFHGFVDDAALVRAYANCDVFCMPSIAELQSLATMEAMAAGKPVVAADAMALPHLVRPGRNGWLYPPGDVAALADRLRDLVTDPAEASRMGAASRELIAEHTLDRTLARFESIYRYVLDCRSPLARRPSARLVTPSGAADAIADTAVERAPRVAS